MNNLKITLVFAVVISLTVSVMLSLVPLAAATASLQEDCEKSGGKWVVKGDNTFCYTTLEPEHCTMSRIEEVDPEFCGISTDSTPTPSACTPTEGATNTTAGRAAGGGGGNQSTTSEVRMRIEEACVALQTGDTQGAMMNLNLALNALVGSNGTQGGNITNATTNATTTTDTNNSNTTTTPTTPTTDEDGTDTTDTGTTAAQSPADSAQEGDPIPDCAPQAC